ncbi:MAG: tRNA pseudouridine(55) synthase TruB [Betaproteobacteria bacterium]|nr:tRNA pseudouridine(55) synthase TruB [Betaproteobacteria bacterium]
MHNITNLESPRARGAVLPRRDITGVLLLDKPFGLSSNTALQRARYLLAARKAGHTGTLDPHATGLLTLCLGEATKFSGWLLDAPKAYQARIRLGYCSTTGDGEGKITPVQPFTGTLATIESVLHCFEGVQSQYPPMHSALKVQGRPLYDYARAGLEVARPPRRIEVLEQKIEAWDGETLTLALKVSKGTYIRVLAADIGAALGCGGYLCGLRRTETGSFALQGAVTLQQLEALSMEEREKCLLPADALLSGVPRIDLDDTQSLAIRQGRGLPCDFAGTPGQRFRVYMPADRFLGICELTAECRLHPARLMTE